MVALVVWCNQQGVTALPPQQLLMVCRSFTAVSYPTGPALSVAELTGED